MQPSSALNKLCDLLKHASEQSSSPQGSLITVCLREADQIYVYPQTLASTMLMRGLRSVGYNVAIKTYPPSIHTLLMHSGENARVVLLEDSSVLPVVDNAACLIQAKITSAAILRDEEALVVWSMGTSNTIDAQFREWERRIARTASHAERQKQRQNQPAMHPAMISPYANDWMPFKDFQGVTPSTSGPSQDFIDLTSLQPRSDLPSLPELESLHGLDGREGCRETFPSDWLSPLDYASLYYHSPFLSPVSTPSTIDSLSPYSAQGTESSLEPSPFLGGTICLADISPVPLSFDDASLPDDDLPITVESADPSGEEESPSSPTNLRKIKGLPSRSVSTSPTPLSPLHLPEAPNSPKTRTESATSPKPHSPSLAQTTATPLFSSLSLRNSPPLSKKRKSPSPSPKSSTSSAKADQSPLPTPSAPLEIPGSPNCEDDADGSTESDLSDLEDDGPAFEDPDDSDDDFEEPPPPKKTKVTAPKAAAKKARPGRRRGGGKASAAHKRKFKCETCGKKFTRDADKTRHLQSACEGAEKDHKCPECPAAFARKDALVRHCKNLHKDD